MLRLVPGFALFPYTTLFRSVVGSTVFVIVKAGLRMCVMTSAQWLVVSPRPSVPSADRKIGVLGKFGASFSQGRTFWTLAPPAASSVNVDGVPGANLSQPATAGLEPKTLSVSEKSSDVLPVLVTVIV